MKCVHVSKRSIKGLKNEAEIKEGKVGDIRLLEINKTEVLEFAVGR